MFAKYIVHLRSEHMLSEDRKEGSPRLMGRYRRSPSTSSQELSQQGAAKGAADLASAETIQADRGRPILREKHPLFRRSHRPISRSPAADHDISGGRSCKIWACQRYVSIRGARSPIDASRSGRSGASEKWPFLPAFLFALSSLDNASETPYTSRHTQGTIDREPWAFSPQD